MKKNFNRLKAALLALACVSLVSCACHKHVVKYGGPPADFHKKPPQNMCDHNARPDQA
jgi:hypothetical protein